MTSVAIARPGLAAHAAALEALRNLRNVCMRMDLEDQAARPTEEQYEAALRDADKALGWNVLTGGEGELLAADRAFNAAKNDGTLQAKADRRALERELNQGGAV